MNPILSQIWPLIKYKNKLTSKESFEWKNFVSKKKLDLLPPKLSQKAKNCVSKVYFGQNKKCWLEKKIWWEKKIWSKNDWILSKASRPSPPHRLVWTQKVWILRAHTGFATLPLSKYGHFDTNMKVKKKNSDRILFTKKLEIFLIWFG